MANKEHKFPRFFIYLLIMPALVMFIGLFFDMNIVGVAYFVALIISFVFMIIDKHYSETLTNYKIAFSFLDSINLVAVIAILTHEYNKHTLILNCFLFALLAVEVILVLIDAIFVKNESVSKYGSVLIDLVKLGSMICILTYFYKVSTLWYSIIALVFELINVIFKIYFSRYHKQIFRKKTKNEELEDRIHSAGDDEGETE